jgi:hypothetical protein
VTTSWSSLTTWKRHDWSTSTALTHKRMGTSGPQRRRLRCLHQVKLKKKKRSTFMKGLLRNGLKRRLDAMILRRKSLRN